MEKVIVEYQIKDNVVRVIKEAYINKKYGTSIRYLFQFQNVNNDNPTFIKQSKTTFHNWKVKNIYSNTRFKTLGSALKHFNKAVAALNNGTNIK